VNSHEIHNSYAEHSLPIGESELSDFSSTPAPLPLYELDPRVIQVDVVGGVIFTALLAVGALVGLAILWVAQGFGIIWYTVAGCAFIGLFGLSVLSLTWPRIEYKNYRWRLDDQSLEVHRGVWFKHRISVPLGRVQHADVAQGPLLRKFGLGTLVINTAGTSNAQIEISGLAHEVAIKLRDRLVQQTQSRVVT
jgi:uncharacterized protein